MSDLNRHLFSMPPPGYSRQVGASGHSPNASGAGAKADTHRYSNVSFMAPPPPPPKTASTLPPPKVIYSSKFQSYSDGQGSSINIENLNKNSSFLNYQQRSLGNSYQKNISESPTKSSTSTTSHASPQTYTRPPTQPAIQPPTTTTSQYAQYPVSYSPQYGAGISYPPPPLPSPALPVAYSTNLPPPQMQYTLNPAAFYVPGHHNNPMPVQMVGSMYHQPQNNGYYQNGYNPNMRKRPMPGEQGHNMMRGSKKKKRPLSQAVPLKKDWSVEDAVRALNVEKEFNKLHKSPSLVLKFPDLELNRDIVQKFNSKIDTVHFQQPSTARYCFVTLQKDVDVEQVIKELNQTRFGYGFLVAEHKKDRDETENIGPEDIDPLTLYVGNLAQEVTIEDVHKAYPKHKRIDIGFAKKMKFTRYAFVCFKNVDDAIEAFQNTHASEMYNKSLIVRFRRLHGTVGLPGETKLQPPRRNNDLEKRAVSNPSPANVDTEERIPPTISINEAEEDEEMDHRTVMQRYITRVKQENPDIEEQEEWFYSDEDENYDTMSDWSGRSTETQRHKTECQKQEQIVHHSFAQPSPSHSLSNIQIKSELPDIYSARLDTRNVSPVSVKTEPEDTSSYVSGNGRLQPIIEQVHRPMLEPKIEPEPLGTACGTTGEVDAQEHRPMLEPKTEVATEPSSSNRYPQPPNHGATCTLEPEEDQVHRPMLEPKIEATEPRRNQEPSCEVDMIHRPMLEPKLEPLDQMPNSENTTNKNNTSPHDNQNLIFDVRPIIIKHEKFEEQPNQKVDAIGKNIKDISSKGNEESSIKIKEEKTDENDKNTSLVDKPNDDESSEDDEDPSYDLNNFLSNLKTGKSFL